MIQETITSLLVIYITTIPLLRPPVYGGHGRWFSRFTPWGKSMLVASLVCVLLQFNSRVFESFEKQVQEISADFNLSEIFWGLNTIEKHTRGVPALKDDFAALNRKLDAIATKQSEMETMLKDRDKKTSSEKKTAQL